MPDALLSAEECMRDAILKRLEAVESRCRKEHMIILAKDQTTGEEAEMTVSECLERGAEFVRVIRAGDLAELDALLSAVMEEAWRQA